jgi:hypothetical protein
MKAEDKKAAVVSQLESAFRELVTARDCAGKRYEPLHEETADICDSVLSLIATMIESDFDSSWFAKTEYPETRLSDTRREDYDEIEGLPPLDRIYARHYHMHVKRG